ncbi:hypothetical protein FACS1894127_7320 [Clostridia bacterium]|nr:hypothetical protein FACS1894127_7320 [Clostridia bacterium]
MRIVVLALKSETIEPDFVDFASCHSCQALYNYARQCRVKGIISGCPGPEGPVFDGNSILTRAEGCAIIVKMLEYEPIRTEILPH